MANVAANQIVTRIPMALRPVNWTEKLVEDLAIGQRSIGLHTGAMQPETIEADGMIWEMSTIKLSKPFPNVGYGSKHPLTHAVIHCRIK